MALRTYAIPPATEKFTANLQSAQKGWRKKAVNNFLKVLRPKMTDVNKETRKTTETKEREFEFRPLCVFPRKITEKSPFRNHGLACVTLVANLARIEVPDALHPSSQTSSMNEADSSRAVTRRRYQMKLICREADPTVIWRRIRAIIILELGF